MHSGLTAAQRNVQWNKIKSGDADVVIGARSACFAPLPKLGLIVVDEEHEPSYKQDSAPRYNGRDLAVKRAHLADAHCILGSATPSLESIYNCTKRGHFELRKLPNRVNNLPMPQMRLIDMTKIKAGENTTNIISPELADGVEKALRRTEQAILLLNRRGYSNFIYCGSCGQSVSCRNCDVKLTFHKSFGRRYKNSEQISRTVAGQTFDGGYAVCHYCLCRTLVPKSCPVCGKGLVMIGLGSQRLEEELAKKFPSARIARIDSDSMNGADYYKILADFAAGDIDILAGTQIIAKGLHFPNVTVVGIVSADTALQLPDFRANERTYHLISQVAGRAGRSQKKGVVYIQTFLPDQPAIRFAVENDFNGFVKEELKHRKHCMLPPFGRMAIVRLSDNNFERLNTAAAKAAERMTSIKNSNRLDMKITGPMPATITRIKSEHRMQIIVQSISAAVISQFFRILRQSGPIKPAVKIVYDIDPLNLL